MSATVLPLKPFLLDGPLMLAPERRTAMVINMGACLVEADAYADRSDAERHLHYCGYHEDDVRLLVDDARQWAVQAVVAAEMGR